MDFQPTSGLPKKRHPWLIVLVIFFAVMLLGIVSCVAILGSADKALKDGVTEAAAAASPSSPAAHDRGASREATPGKAFKVGKHKMLGGWRVAKDTSLGAALFNVTGKVKNVSNARSTALIDFTFINAAGEVIGIVRCNSADLKPGQTQALNCIPDGKYRRYQTVTAQATV